MDQSVFKLRLGWNRFIPFIIYFFSLIIEKEAYGTYFTSWVFSLLLIVVGIIYYCRQRLFQQLLVLPMLGLSLLHYFIGARLNVNIHMLNLIGINGFGEETTNFISNHLGVYSWAIHFLIVLVLMMFFAKTVIISFQLESAARKILSLSVKYVGESSGSYTERPFPSGSINYTNEEIHGFSAFLEAKNIVKVVNEDGNFILSFSMGISPLSNPDLSSISYFQIDSDGNTAVHISVKDYYQYRKKYSFDQLCDAVANLFKRFFNEYKAHNEKRILTELGIK
ncbi:MAG: hypothetical protein K8S00_06755 [Bacteroidales bacterium]|nr:hypothetical protein [Bacteroidales bacterium]